ncbi:hypothetical protein bas27_0186 [Escherichia phage TrudiGerster]|uniref:Uncharacterized protein n=1 Tax=Escherichia phage TrudiGerster TaxID=2851991 RepID=A0AAE7W1T9_9CAUD|nr:hypothetical protein bas27_0186 [Escherichia phage TrudiGerster]
MSEKYGLPVSGKANHDMIVISDCNTGYCGENWTEEHFIPAGCDLDAFAQELAYDNASRFENDEDFESGIEDNSIEGSLYKYQLTQSGIYVNGGDPIGTVTRWIVKHGGVAINDNKALLYANRLKQLVYIPEGKEWEEYNVLIQALRELYSIEVTEIA